MRNLDHCGIAFGKGEGVYSRDTERAGGRRKRIPRKFCRKSLGLKMPVLPVRKPQLNGIVKRFNRALRDAFYSRYGGPWNVGEVSKALEGYIKHDNEERCHTAMGVPPYFYAQNLRIAA